MTPHHAGAIRDIGTVLAEYYLLPLAVALTLALITFGTWVVRQLNTTSQGLALILQDVRPPGAPSLRDMVIDLRAQVVNNDKDARTRSRPAPQRRD